MEWRYCTVQPGYNIVFICGYYLVQIKQHLDLGNSWLTKCLNEE